MQRKEYAMSHLEGRTATLDADARWAADKKRAFELVAETALQRSCYHPVRSLSCDYDDGVLTLRGQVSSFYLKQIAQTVVGHRLKDLVTINNQVEVT
jgi:hypothetical protein